MDCGGKIVMEDVLKLEPISTLPTTGTDGELCVSGTIGNYHIYCYLNGAWKQLD